MTDEQREAISASVDEAPIDAVRAFVLEMDDGADSDAPESLVRSRAVELLCDSVDDGINTLAFACDFFRGEAR